MARRKIPLSPNIPRGYKGLLLADVNPKNAYKDEVIADLGEKGLWKWAHNGYPGDWTQLTGNNAQ